MKAAGANTQQHVLRSEGKEPPGPCGTAGHGLIMIWIPELENHPEGLASLWKAGKGGLAERSSIPPFLPLSKPGGYSERLQELHRHMGAA